MSYNIAEIDHVSADVLWRGLKAVQASQDMPFVFADESGFRLRSNRVSSRPPRQWKMKTYPIHVAILVDEPST